MPGFGSALVFEQNRARVRKVVSFTAETAALLALEVNEWCEDAGEKVVIETTYLATTVTAESLQIIEYACFITYTE